MRKLYSPDPANGKHKATIENDEVEITAFVRVLKDPTGVLWHNFVKYVCRSPVTGQEQRIRRRS